MKNLFIIHSYNGDTKETFGPYIKEQAQKLGIRVYFPDFPIKKEANYKSWSSIMDKYLKNGDLNSESMIIAHSLGTHFIPKYISDRNIPIDLYISCAGFINDHSDRTDLQGLVKEFIPSDEQINRFINLVNNRYSIYSNNDHINPQEKLEYYADRIAATRVFVPNIGHMGTKSNITELPEALEIIKNHYNKEKDKMNIDEILKIIKSKDFYFRSLIDNFRYEYLSDQEFDSRLNQEFAILETYAYFKRDNLTIYYNDRFFNQLSTEEQAFVIAHEILHYYININIPKSKLFYYDYYLINFVLDAQINQILVRYGFTPIKGAILINDALDFEALELYDLLYPYSQYTRAYNNREKYDWTSNKSLSEILNIPIKKDSNSSFSSI